MEVSNKTEIGDDLALRAFGSHYEVSESYPWTVPGPARWLAVQTFERFDDGQILRLNLQAVVRAGARAPREFSLVVRCGGKTRAFRPVDSTVERSRAVGSRRRGRWQVSLNFAIPAALVGDDGVEFRLLSRRLEFELPFPVLVPFGERGSRFSVGAVASAAAIGVGTMLSLPAAALAATGSATAEPAALTAGASATPTTSGASDSSTSADSGTATSSSSGTSSTSTSSTSTTASSSTTGTQASGGDDSSTSTTPTSSDSGTGSSTTASGTGTTTGSGSTSPTTTTGTDTSSSTSSSTSGTGTSSSATGGTSTDKPTTKSTKKSTKKKSTKTSTAKKTTSTLSELVNKAASDLGSTRVVTATVTTVTTTTSVTETDGATQQATVIPADTTTAYTTTTSDDATSVDTSSVSLSSLWGGTTMSDPFSSAELNTFAKEAKDVAAPPKYLVKIYKQAARKYNLPWELLAAINYIETDYGADLSESSAGAVGWMQFMPSTWAEYGEAVSADGQIEVGQTANADSPEDAIFSAARLLVASGAHTSIAKAVYSYNHAEWYVQEVLTLSERIAANSLGKHPKAQARVAAMVTMAKLLNGATYVWGGGHTASDWIVESGYDCSGFVSAVLHAGGVLKLTQTTQTLPTAAGIVQGAGKYVTIFDRTDAGSGEDHVIIDLDGTFWEEGGGGTSGANEVHRMKNVSATYLASFDLILHPQGL